MQSLTNFMPLRSLFLGLFTVIAIAFLGDHFISAQETTNFAVWKESKNAQSIPDWTRRMLVRDFRDLTGDPRQERLEAYLAELKNIVSDTQVVLSTRYNALLAIGQLVSKEGTSGNLPTAYPAALIYLVDVYQQTDTPAFLKFGALLGIVRHTHCGINDTMSGDVIELLLQTISTKNSGYAIISQDDFAPPLEPEVWNWFRQTALEGLSALKMTGTNEKVIKELLSVLNQSTQELEETCQRKDMVNHDEWKQIRQNIDWASKIAKTLGDLDYRSADNVDTNIVDVKAMTDALIRLTQAVFDVEHKIAADVLGQKNTSVDTTTLTERIVIDLKICTQSVAWGIRSAFLLGKPAEHSFYTSQTKDEQAIKRLGSFLKVLSDLSVLLDEGNKMNQQQKTADSGANTGMSRSGGGFKFSIPELQDALQKFSETLETL